MASSAPESGESPRGEVLRSNVDDAPVTPSPKRAGGGVGVLPLVLGGVLLFVLGVGVALFVTSGSQRAQQSATAATRPTAAAVSGAPVPGVGGQSGAATTSASSGAQADVNGISCDSLESTVVHNHVHVAIFVNGQEVQIPFGIGIAQPWQVSDSDEGPFVDDGACFYWLHTHTEDGIVHIESPVRRRFTLGDFFAVWQMPLGPNQVGAAQGQVISYVNGQRSSTAPQDIPLLPHERIQLDVGGDVPPYPFDFPDGD